MVAILDLKTTLAKMPMMQGRRPESTEAERCWGRILSLERPDQSCSVDRGIYGHLARRDLAALAAERGDRAVADRLWRALLAECPRDREALANLAGSSGR